jgi:hypothetical protein
MGSFLICENPSCHMVLDLRENGNVLPRSEIINACPECGSSWSNTCPFCSQPLEVAWQDSLPHCLSCRQKLRARVAEAAREKSALHRGIERFPRETPDV